MRPISPKNPPGPREWVPLRVTTVMRFTKRKRPHEVVRAIPKINALLPEGVRPLFTLVGDGPERARVEKEVKRLGVGAQVELTGFRPRHEIREILARSSLLEEAFNKRNGAARSKNFLSRHGGTVVGRHIHMPGLRYLWV